MSETLTAPSAIRWRWIVALWFAGAVFMASQAIVFRHMEGKHLEEIPVFLIEVGAWLPWLLAAPAVAGVARRVPIVRGRVAWALATHVSVWAAISAAMGAWSAVLHEAFDPWGLRQAATFWDVWGATQFFQAVNSLAAYVMILTVTSLVDARERAARQTAEAARLGAELSNARLAALRRQMEPHFLFNTLNAIAGLVRDDRKRAAVDMIVGLSELLRRSSEDSHRAQVTLAEEVEYLDRYVGIQKVRFGDRLQVTVDISSDLRAAQTPYLLLQPLVENAIQHGVSRLLTGGGVSIQAMRVGDLLRLSVHNDGPDLADGPRAGIGLSNLRTRLQILYGDKAELRLGAADRGGVEAVVTLPYVTT